jgi:cyclic beta-1,2-glucan glucanotransferase
LISAFEVTLAESVADEAHPAFSNLFVRAHWHRAYDALLWERTPRLPAEPVLHAAHFFAGSDAPVGAIQVETDRAKWLGRNRDASQPLAAFERPVPGANQSDVE